MIQDTYFSNRDIDKCLREIEDPQIREVVTLLLYRIQALEHEVNQMERSHE